MQLLVGFFFILPLELRRRTLATKYSEIICSWQALALCFFSAGVKGSVITTVYPPFGFATISSYGLGSYLILLGLYLSALSVSQDEQLRNMIKRSTLSESKFLQSIGSSAGEREKVIINTVIDKARQGKIQSLKTLG